MGSTERTSSVARTIAEAHYPEAVESMGALGSIGLIPAALAEAAASAPEHFGAPGPRQLAEAERYVSAYLRALGFTISPTADTQAARGPVVER